MVSAVLYAKNGVITEERFQKLTHVQWAFHYHEVMMNKQSEHEREDNIVQAILNNIESVGMLANPKLATKIIEKRKEKETIKGIESGEDEMLKFYNNVIDKMPATLNVEYDKNTKNKFFLPKYKRDKKKKPGIILQEDKTEPRESRFSAFQPEKLDTKSKLTSGWVDIDMDKEAGENND